MFGIGVPELLMILVIGLIVFGPGKLPEIGRSLGKTVNEFRKITSSINLDPPPAKPAERPAAKAVTPEEARQSVVAAAGIGEKQEKPEEKAETAEVKANENKEA